ncbi:hypothetical protein ACIA74_40905 [Streptomyces sp. NPDC051658]|uniref:hypothetical protein n=1 Tax=Streptomyces sp. NPDC051658 TaxID=3365667 RepID=UPI0037896433
MSDHRDNLLARIAEAEREGWLGEIEGLRISLAGAEDKLARIDQRSSRAIDPGMPGRAAGPVLSSLVMSHSALSCPQRHARSAPRMTGGPSRSRHDTDAATRFKL